MANDAALTRLVVNGDDFGASASANRAILQAHRDGILTTASLLVNGQAFTEAIAIARDCPRLGVGLHLCLVRGTSILPPAHLPGLVDERRHFSTRPVVAGLRYCFQKGLRDPLRREIHAQIDRFLQTGLSLDHINGHLNLHLHPVVLGVLLEAGRELRQTGFRLTRDPLRLNLRLASGALGYRLSHAILFTALSRWALGRMTTPGWRHTRAVFGLLQNGRVTEDYVLRLLPHLLPGNYELYSHPSLDEAPHELAALVSAKIRQRVETLGIQLVRYQDL